MTSKASSHAQTSTEGQHSNGAPAISHSGLDMQGEFRIGANFTLAVRGSDLVIRQANSGREVTMSEATLEGLIKSEYFDEKAD